MDGASKYVRGDAIAGLLILFINIVGGFIIGVVQHGLSASQAAKPTTREEQREANPDARWDDLTAVDTLGPTASARVVHGLLHLEPELETEPARRSF